MNDSLRFFASGSERMEFVFFLFLEKKEEEKISRTIFFFQDFIGPSCEMICETVHNRIVVELNFCIKIL